MSLSLLSSLLVILTSGCYNSWTFGNQLYVLLSLQVDDLSNSLTQSIQSYTDITITIENFIGLSRVNYACIASNQSKFALPDLLITIKMNSS